MKKTVIEEHVELIDEITTAYTKYDSDIPVRKTGLLKDVIKSMPHIVGEYVNQSNEMNLMKLLSRFAGIRGLALPLSDGTLINWDSSNFYIKDDECVLSMFKAFIDVKKEACESGSTLNTQYSKIQDLTASYESDLNLKKRTGAGGKLTTKEGEGGARIYSCVLDNHHISFLETKDHLYIVNRGLGIRVMPKFLHYDESLMYKSGVTRYHKVKSKGGGLHTLLEIRGGPMSILLRPLTISKLHQEIKSMVVPDTEELIFPMKAQKMGNCTTANTKGLVLAIMHHCQSNTQIDGPELRKSIKTTYKEFTRQTRLSLLQTYLSLPTIGKDIASLDALQHQFIHRLYIKLGPELGLNTSLTGKIITRLLGLNAKVYANDAKQIFLNHFTDTDTHSISKELTSKMSTWSALKLAFSVARGAENSETSINLSGKSGNTVDENLTILSKSRDELLEKASRPKPATRNKGFEEQMSLFRSMGDKPDLLDKGKNDTERLDRLEDEESSHRERESDIPLLEEVCSEIMNLNPPHLYAQDVLVENMSRCVRLSMQEGDHQEERSVTSSPLASDELGLTDTAVQEENETSEKSPLPAQKRKPR